MNLVYRWLTSFEVDTTATTYPNVDWWSQRPTSASLTRGVKFPDDADLLLGASVELVGGNFTTVVNPYEGTFDVIITQFFIDTARNVFSYLLTIHTLLKPGGVWIKCGPLLYGTSPTIQLQRDEAIALAKELGLENVEPGHNCGDPLLSDRRWRRAAVLYNADPQNLSRNTYLAQHWVATKKQ